MDELSRLLLDTADNEDNAACNRPRGVAIVAALPPECLWDFIRQRTLLQQTPRHRQQLALHTYRDAGDEAALSEGGEQEETPDSPTRLTPAIDQLYSPCLSPKGYNDEGAAEAASNDTQQLPDSPVQQLSRTARSTPDAEHMQPQHQQQQPPQPSGRRFLAESLELNLGASFDLLAKASLADFSTAAAGAGAAASRLSSTCLARQSRMRTLSPVAEASFVSARTDTPQQSELLRTEEHNNNDSSESGWQLQQQQPTYAGSISSSPSQHQQSVVMRSSLASTQHTLSSAASGALSPDCGGDPPAGDMCPSTCSSPHEPPPAGRVSSSGGAAAAFVRRSVAESAHDWPLSQPLPFMLACDADGDANTSELVDVTHNTPAQQMAAFSQAAVPPAAATVTAGYAAAQPGQITQQQQQLYSAPISRIGTGSALPALPDSSTNQRRSSSSGGGGANPLGQIVRAPIHGANALRKSLTRLWGGGRGTAASRPTKPAGGTVTAVTAATPSSIAKTPAAGGRSLACASAPMASVYGGAAGGGSSRLPGYTPSFGVTAKGSSPTKAATAAAAASAASARKAAAAAAARLASTPQQRMGSSSIGYRPPNAPARTPVTPGHPSSSRVKSATPTAGCSSAYTRTGSTTPSSNTHNNSRMAHLQQHGSGGHLSHGHAAFERPSSQASFASYARSDVTATGTASHTSGGSAVGRFTATQQVIDNKKTPALKQLPPRTRKAQAAAAAAAAAATATLQAAQAGVVGFGGSSSGGMGSASRIPRQIGPSTPSSALKTGTIGSSSSRVKSRIGAGVSQLRRSRSLGSLVEVLDVANVRHMWHQLEQQQHHQIQPQHRLAGATATPPAAAAQGKHGLRHYQHARGNVPAAPGLPQQSAFGSSQVQGVARQQQALHVPASGPDQAELPLLNRCQSPTQGTSSTQHHHHHHHQEPRAEASLVLARMGNVISNVDALLLGDGGGSHSSSSGGGACPAGSGPVSAVAGSSAATAAARGVVGHSPLIHKLVQGAVAGSVSGIPAAAADRLGQGGIASGGMLGSRQQVLLTPPVQLQPGGALPATAPHAQPQHVAGSSGQPESAEMLNRRLF